MSLLRSWTLALAVAAVAHPAHAQVTGGEDPSRRSSAEPAAAPAAEIRGGLYLRGGSMSASGDYGSLPSQTGYMYYTQEAAEKGLSGGAAATSGYYGELGLIRYLGLPVPPIVRVGIDASVSAGYMNFDWNGIYGTEPNDQMGELLADAKIGPIVTVMPVNGLRLDAALKFGVGAAGGSYVYVSSGENYVDDEHAELATGSSRAFTLSARYSGFTVGWEMSSISAARNRDYSASGPNGDGMFMYTSDIPASTSRLFFGFSR